MRQGASVGFRVFEASPRTTACCKKSNYVGETPAQKPRGVFASVLHAASSANSTIHLLKPCDRTCADRALTALLLPPPGFVRRRRNTHKVVKVVHPSLPSIWAAHNAPAQREIGAASSADTGRRRRVTRKKK